VNKRRRRRRRRKNKFVPCKDGSVQRARRRNRIKRRFCAGQEDYPQE
jgi:hypothetical protein